MRKEVKTHPDIELRYRRDGTIDEIVIISNDELLLHLKPLNDSYEIELAGEEDGDPVYIDLHSEQPVIARMR